MYYLYFFIWGGYFWKYTSTLANFASKPRNIIFSILIFMILLISVNYIISYNNGVIESTTLAKKAILLSINKTSKAILASSGIVMLFLMASAYMRNHSLSEWIIKAGYLGYGVYIFHQFILRWFYYHTSISLNLGRWLPWVGFTFTMVVSVVLTMLLRKFKFGRKLI